MGSQSALATAFEPTPLPQVSVAPPAPPANAAGASLSTVELTPPPPLSPGPPAVDSTSLSSLEESGFGGDWKSEYEAQVSEWRAKSAEQRAKAEEERKKWEEIRATEEKERRSELAASSFSSGWESLSASGVSVGVSSKGDAPLDIQSLVDNLGGGEAQAGKAKEVCSRFVCAFVASDTVVLVLI